MCIVQITKSVIQKLMRFSCNIYIYIYIYIYQQYWNTPLAKFLNGQANLIQARTASRYFVPFLWILGPIFWSKISKSFFVMLAKFLNHEPTSICNSRRRSCPCWSTPLNKRLVHKSFAYFCRFFLLITNTSIHPAHIQAATSWHGLIQWAHQLSANTKHYMRSVRGHCA
jgi:hypothetical protein